MFASRKRRPNTFTLAAASLPSTSTPRKTVRDSSREVLTNPQIAPVQLQTFQRTTSDTGTSDVTPEFAISRRKNPLEWIFPFLADGTTSIPATSNALGPPNKTALFRQRQATGGLFSPNVQSRDSQLDLRGATAANNDSKQAPDKSSSPPSSVPGNYLFPPWSSWKDWKKISLDFYIRLLDTPLHSRLRLKQTIAPLPIVKLKPVIDLAYRGPSKSPLTMHMDVKILDCIKYRVHSDGSSHLQVRAKAPMSDPRFTMDVIYERQLGTALDSVKITFRALDAAFLKAPNPGFGCKVPIRFNNGIKTTIRVKKFIDCVHDMPSASGRAPKYTRRAHSVAPKPRTPRQSMPFASGSRSTRQRLNTISNRIGVFGPIGVDIKLRCLEYR